MTMNLPLLPPLPPMEAEQVEALPRGEQWGYEPKWDGFRCLAFRDGEEVYRPRAGSGSWPRRRPPS